MKEHEAVEPSQHQQVLPDFAEPPSIKSLIRATTEAAAALRSIWGDRYQGFVERLPVALSTGAELVTTLPDGRCVYIYGFAGPDGQMYDIVATSSLDSISVASGIKWSVERVVLRNVNELRRLGPLRKTYLRMLMGALSFAPRTPKGK